MERLVTIEHHIYEQQKHFPGATGEFSGLLLELALAGKIIAREVNRAGLGDILGATGETNVQGERVQKLDRFARDVLVTILRRGGHVAVIATEEDPAPIQVARDRPRGHYLVTLDPLDGSSNIDANVSVGTIFGIFRQEDVEARAAACEVCRPGHEQVGAGYLVYGSSTMMVYAARDGGVHGFTLDPAIGEFLLSHPDLRIPERGYIFSINEGYAAWWKDHTRRYVAHLKEPGADRPYSGRYIGSLVADFHRNLLYGGIFLYPEDERDPAQPHGKLRLVYEAAPLAFVAEAAGGKATTGAVPILGIVPDEVHQRVPFIVGSRRDVEDYEAFCRGGSP